MSLRIGILGSTCVGKTTLASELNKNLNLHTIDEKARDLFKEEINKPDFNRNNPDWQYNFQLKIYELKIKEELKYFDDGFIADRTHLDNFMYFLFYCKDIIKSREKCLMIEGIFKEAMKVYTHIFFLDLDRIPYVNDTIRTETFTHSLLYESCIIGLIKRWGIKVFPICYSKIEERVKYIKDVIKGPTKPISGFCINSGGREI